MKSKVQNRSTKQDEITREMPMACADEATAVEFMENKRWGDTPVCPSCGCLNVYQMKDSKTGERQANFRWKCRECKDQYTVRKGTVFEESRIELRHWCFAFWRAATSKKGVSALEIHRQTGVSYKSALFMLQRIRFSMQEDTPPVGGTVEVDETYVGGKPRNRNSKNKRGRGTSKPPVLAMVQRGGNVNVRPVADVTGYTLKKAILENVSRDARIITDDNRSYRGIGAYYAGGHETTNHSKGEYARGDIHSNTVESFFSGVKRGINGIHHAVSKERLGLYLAHYGFLWNHRDLEDGQRIVAAIKASEGKRLRYETPING